MYIRDEMGQWLQRNLLSENGRVKGHLFFIRRHSWTFSRMKQKPTKPGASLALQQLGAEDLTGFFPV